jgi:hypothetical protein
MKFSYFVLIGTIIVILSSSILITENLQPIDREVFAQSDNANKDFKNAKETHSSQTGTKNMNENPVIVKFDNKDSKIHPQISKILQHANPNAIAKILGSQMDGDKLYVYVHLNDKIPNKALDIEISGQYKNIIVSKLNLQQIQTLAENDSVKKITLPDIAVPYPHGVSEGVSFSLADQMHAAGFNGTGIKVAIIDSGFSANNIHIMNNIAPNGIWFASGCDDLACNNELGPTHGTAVAEIVVDMAPAVELYLYSIVFSTDFATAIDDAILKDVDIITASLGFPDEFGENKFLRDGTSLSAKKVNEAQANQTIVTIAAGNSGEAHWSGFYTPNATRLGPNLESDLFDPNNGIVCNIFNFTSEECIEIQVYESVMMFDSSATNSSMQACLPISYERGKPIDISWSAFPVTDQDYDFFIYDSTANNFLNSDAQAIAVENGDDIPRTVTSTLDVVSQQDVCLVIAAASTNSTHLFHIDTDFRTNSTINLPDFDPGRFGSISTPADAAGAFTIGAVDFNNSTSTYTDDEIRTYSSLGPTDDGRTAEGAQGRIKPEICGPDGTSSTQFGGIFTGTSAATPHVAGALALLIEENRTKGLNLNSTEIQQKLITDARFNSTFSVDNLCGSGSLELNLTPSSTITVIKTANGGDETFDFTTTVSDENLDGNFTGNNGFEINTGADNSVRFTGLSPDQNYTITESSEFGWEFNSISCIGSANTPLVSGTTVTINPNDGEEIDCTFTNTLPTLKLVKNVINNNNGTANAGDWNLTATFNGTRDINDFGNSTTFYPVFADNIYTLDESIVPGYGQIGDWSCDKGVTVSNGNQITLNQTNTQITCTVTNDDLSPCSPPPLGDWEVNSSCEMTASATVNTGSLIVQNNSVLTIPNGVTLDIDFQNHNLTVKFGSGILIKDGGSIS